jgi:hypothetical protein
VVLSRTAPDHLHVIAEEVCRVAKLCIGQDMGTMSTATAFMEMEAGSFQRGLLGELFPSFPGT